MKRFASHYLYLSGVGLLKQQVIEITNAGWVSDIFPLTEEIESVEWMPGLIILLPENDKKNIEMILKNISMFNDNSPIVLSESSQYLKKYLSDLEKSETAMFPYLLYPFDFTLMKPVDGTRHKLLQ